MVQFSTYAPGQGYLPLRSAGPPAFFPAFSRSMQHPPPNFTQGKDILTLSQAPFATHTLSTPGVHPLLNTLALLIQQNTSGKKAHNLAPITPKKGAEVGAISLGAMGLLFKGFSGLLWGGFIGAVAGSSIVSVIKRQSK